MDDLAPFTTHGGRIDAARTRYGGEDWIDLSTGIAPWAYPVETAALGFDRLPEPEAIAGLEQAAAATFGVDPFCVVAVPGTDLAMRLLARLIAARRPAVAQPCYAGHSAAWPEAVAIAEEALVQRGDGALAGDCDLLVLASPANPSGRTIDPASLDAIATTATVVLDQAYADPAPCPPTTDGLIVLRSFGKFYGLPGARLGFVVCGATISGRLRTLLGDWPISSAAAVIGTAAYRDRAWREAQAERIDTMGDRLDAVVARAGLSIIGRPSLFRQIETEDAARLFRRLAGHAILARPFADLPRRLRIGLPGHDAALHRLERALEDKDD